MLVLCCLLDTACEGWTDGGHLSTRSSLVRLPLFPTTRCVSPNTKTTRHVGGGGNAVDVDYGSMLFEVSQLDLSLDIT